MLQRKPAQILPEKENAQFINQPIKLYIISWCQSFSTNYAIRKIKQLHFAYN